jgi:hypothetical protein
LSNLQIARSIRRLAFPGAALIAGLFSLYALNPGSFAGLASSALAGSLFMDSLRELFDRLLKDEPVADVQDELEALTLEEDSEHLASLAEAVQGLIPWDEFKDDLRRAWRADMAELEKRLSDKGE